MTDTERLDWLEKKGFGGGIISDDDGRWAFPFGGHQPLVVGKPTGGVWSFFMEPEDWKPSVREAIDYAVKVMKESDDDSTAT